MPLVPTIDILFKDSHKYLNKGPAGDKLWLDTLPRPPFPLPAHVTSPANNQHSRRRLRPGSQPKNLQSPHQRTNHKQHHKRRIIFHLRRAPTTLPRRRITLFCYRRKADE
jgi:hypothetical protein